MAQKYNPEIHHRYSVRLGDYDYAKPNWYFITICTKNREWLFGEIRKGKIELNGYGQIARECWFYVFENMSYVTLDEFVVMPNHVHGILRIVPHVCRGVTNSQCRGVRFSREPYAPTKDDEHKPLKGPVAKSLGAMIRGYKSSVTQRIRFIDDYEGNIWQRNYHEHIIRNADELRILRQYIVENPQNWDRDEENIS